MAWDSYTGHHHINVTPAGANCLVVNQRRKTSGVNVAIGRVCQQPNGKWRYSYVGGGPNTLYGDLPNVRAAVKATVRRWRTYMGVQSTAFGRSRRRRRR